MRMPAKDLIRAASTAALVSLLASLAPAQDAKTDAKPAIFPADTALVVLDLVVRDKKGQPVRDLRPDEVQVFEDGDPARRGRRSDSSRRALPPSRPTRPRPRPGPRLRSVNPTRLLEPHDPDLRAPRRRHRGARAQGRAPVPRTRPRRAVARRRRASGPGAQPGPALHQQRRAPAPRGRARHQCGARRTAERAGAGPARGRVLPEARCGGDHDRGWSDGYPDVSARSGPRRRGLRPLRSSVRWEQATPGRRPPSESWPRSRPSPCARPTSSSGSSRASRRSGRSWRCSRPRKSWPAARRSCSSRRGCGCPRTSTACSGRRSVRPTARMSASTASTCAASTPRANSPPPGAALRQAAAASYLQNTRMEGRRHPRRGRDLRHRGGRAAAERDGHAPRPFRKHRRPAHREHERPRPAAGAGGVRPPALLRGLLRSRAERIRRQVPEDRSQAGPEGSLRPGPQRLLRASPRRLDSLPLRGAAAGALSTRGPGPTTSTSAPAFPSARKASPRWPSTFPSTGCRSPWTPGKKTYRLGSFDPGRGQVPGRPGRRAAQRRLPDDGSRREARRAPRQESGAASPARRSAGRIRPRNGGPREGVRPRQRGPVALLGAGAGRGAGPAARPGCPAPAGSLGRPRSRRGQPPRPGRARSASCARRSRATARRRRGLGGGARRPAAWNA